MTERPFIAARLEDRINNSLNGVLRRLGWREKVVGYTGYGNREFVRVLARVVLTPTDEVVPLPVAETLDRRGWRNFFNAPVVRAEVTVRTGERVSTAVVSRNGYLDLRILEHGMEPGWQTVTIQTEGSDPCEVEVMVLDDEETFGVVSDIDDTVISTSLPRPLLAFWNTIVLQESARQPVAGMADMYRELLAEHPGAPVVYVSTGAWNTAGTLNRFLGHHSFPRGPLLLTDWGPTNTGWFRSGPKHKLECLFALAHDFPRISWVLVGDDGQHDPTLYNQFAARFPDRVRVIGIRELTPAEQVLAHGTPVTRLDEQQTSGQRGAAIEVRAPDGRGLLPLLRRGLSEPAGSRR
ncbi:App1 family protein [Auraticoccus monumenti]|uniref:Phosphatidate phosphatase APP1 n=1 Tax=Auraticoccus monumenti TaxID=675864 RepID=A0A1G7CGP4_9ACTN|nr:phosphatase domain-containing protein [Auraticoccus monumenti]SDE38423.1 Phosphatidate phosphatase APP1 [Auraticoccus monumenti]